MSVFCSDGHYFVLDAGQLDSVIMMQGYWRYCYNSNTGLVTAYIARNEGGTDIVNASGNPQDIIIRGGYGESGNEITQHAAVQLSPSDQPCNPRPEVLHPCPSQRRKNLRQPPGFGKQYSP